MNLAEELTARGLVEHHSAPLEEIFAKPRTVYLGVDPSADSMQAGNLVVVLLMKRLADAGNKIVLLVGGGTGMIGDPRESGERQLADPKTVEKNAKAIRAQMERIIGKKIKVVNNADWLLKVKLVDFLRDIGKHFTVNELVKRDIIRRRLETPDESISYTEFAYSLLQGFDYLTLNRQMGVDLQIGASDQWTNILSGVELIRRKDGGTAYAFTCPLVTDANGKKFGKSEGNAVWLDPKKTSPFQFYQFWLNQGDEMVETYLNFYTFMSVEDIDALMEKHRANPGERDAQETLASQVTMLVHGPAAAAEAAAATDALFGGRPFHELSREERECALAEAPVFVIPKKELAAGYPLATALAEGGLTPSKSEARRLIEARGITLSGFPVPNPDQKLYAADLPGGYALARRGKRSVLILQTGK
ncbi:MAG TPA: tyrosine--tRNA ligase [Candidatus Paceibacterota bacterium]